MSERDVEDQYTADLEERIAELEDELEDWRNSAIKAAGEGCGDEVHCTCVGPLRNKVAELQELNSAKDEVIRERDNQISILQKETATWKSNYVDSVYACLVAAGAPEDINEMEPVVRSAGTKPSHFIKKVVDDLNRRIKELENNL